MWWKNTLRRNRSAARGATATTLLDEAFLRRLERLSLSASRMLRGGLVGAHPSIRRLPAPTFSDHRAYSPSDDLRYVDWNAYARQEHLHVKLGETEQDIAVHLLLDRSRSMDYGAGDTNKLHCGRLLMAALGYLALSSGDRLEASAFDIGIAQHWGPAHSRAQALSLLRYARAVEAGAQGDPQQAIEAYTRLGGGGMLVLVSDLWAVGDLDRLLRLVQPPRWQILVLHLLHRDELEPALRGDLELEDSEQGDRIALHADAQTLERYNERLRGWFSAVEQTCARRGAQYTRLASDMPLERATIPYLRHRQVLQG